MMKIVIKLLTLLFIFQVSLSVQASGKWVNKKKTLPMLECTNRDLLNIIDSIFIQDRYCPYYSDSLWLSIMILHYPNRNEDLQLTFETGLESKKNIFFAIKPIGYFKMAKHICFIYFNMPESLFSMTKKKHIFYYKEYAPPKRLKKGEIPLIISSDDDSFSNWIYDFDGKKFKLLERYLCR
ncbi:hypothetical protein [uncultured Bacteroides sp.]|uniref:hypothetical protein n=1 Tax=uncultured Bacteroides sp. TaxID=162156 RepID=UPI002AAB4D20|nr:hypothetical protein [uncultured Bacteroides sp.]